MRIKWFGHSAFQVEIDGKTFLIDPWLTNPVSPVKGEPSVDADYILVTHDHGDHLGDAVTIMKRSGKAKAVAIFEIANYIAEAVGDSSRVIDANIGGPIDLGEGLYAVLTPAFHSSMRGHPTGVVFGKEGKMVYHAGDTGLMYDMKLIGELYTPVVAMLPIGGHYTMGPKEAAKAAELINPEYVIPMHYGTFPVIKGTPGEFKEWLSKFAPHVKPIILKPGEEVAI